MALQNNKTAITNISKYFILWGILSFIGLKVKAIVLSRIAENGFQEITNGIFTFNEVHNTGAAFNLFTNNTLELTILAAIFTAIITAVVIVKADELKSQTVSALALLVTGIALNAAERATHGYVTDYIYLNSFKFFQVFNLADIMIVIGALVLALPIIGRKKVK